MEPYTPALCCSWLDVGCPACLKAWEEQCVHQLFGQNTWELLCSVSSLQQEI